MNQILEALERLKFFAKQALDKIENSIWLEKLIHKFDSLEPKMQRTVLGGIRLGSVLLVMIILILPLTRIAKMRSDLNSQRALLGKLVTLNEEKDNKPTTPMPPRDWQQIDGSTTEALKTSLDGILLSIGLAPETYEANNTGRQLDLKISKLNLRQVQYLLHQVDGWYPGVRVADVRLNVNPEDEKLLSMTLGMLVTNEPSPLSGAGNGRSSARGSRGGSSRSAPSMGANSFDDDDMGGGVDEGGTMAPSTGDGGETFNRARSKPEVFEGMEGLDDNELPPAMDDEDF